MNHSFSNTIYWYSTLLINYSLEHAIIKAKVLQNCVNLCDLVIIIFVTKWLWNTDTILLLLQSYYKSTLTLSYCWCPDTPAILVWESSDGFVLRVFVTLFLPLYYISWLHFQTNKTKCILPPRKAAILLWWSTFKGNIVNHWSRNYAAPGRQNSWKMKVDNDV